MILEYIEYLREKSATLLDKVTENQLKMKSGFGWLRFTRYETLIYALRHLMEHTGQVIAYMRSEGHIAGRWVGVGKL